MSEIKVLYCENDDLVRETIEDHFRYNVQNIAGIPVSLTTTNSLTDYTDSINEYDVLVMDVFGAMGDIFTKHTTLIRVIAELRESYLGIIILYTAMTGWDEYVCDPNLREVQKGADSEEDLVAVIEEMMAISPTPSESGNL